MVVLAAVAVGLYALDQGSKLLVTQNLELGEQVEVLGPLLQLHYVTNSGAAFSLGSGFTWILSIVALGAIAFIIGFAPRIRSLGWAVMFGLVLGGALGNVTDRLFREPSFGQGHVVDFLQLYAFPAIFNVADIGVTSAMVVFIILSIRGVGLDGTRTATVKTTDPDAADSGTPSDTAPADESAGPRT